MSASLQAAREHWTSRLGFSLAALGAAVGLGNIWRFSYVAGEHGGGAFLLVYIACVLLLGLPLMLAEFVLGKRAQADAVTAFERLAPESAWAAGGWLAMICAFLILSYYAVITGWCYKYLVDYVRGIGSAMAGADQRDAFDQFVRHPYAPLLWQSLVIATSAIVVARGVRRGIEAINKVLMPLLAVLVIVLACYSMTLDAPLRGLHFMLRPDWSALLKPDVYLAGLGQALFSLGIGMGVLLTYGSYAKREIRLAPAAALIALGDTLFALIAGLAIFPALFAFSLQPAQGPELAFIVLPQVISAMPGGRLFGAAFFFLLAAAALTSAVSLLEVPVAFALDRFKISRPRAAALVGCAALIAGVPSALGLAWAGFDRLSGPAAIAFIDGVASHALLPPSAFLLALFAARVCSVRDLPELDTASRLLARLWLGALRYVVPVLILLALAGSLRA
jgi:NSS family neurotransmitter:Na+ symporter